MLFSFHINWNIVIIGSKIWVMKLEHDTYTATSMTNWPLQNVKRNSRGKGKIGRFEENSMSHPINLEVQKMSLKMP